MEYGSRKQLPVFCFPQKPSAQLLKSNLLRFYRDFDHLIAVFFQLLLIGQKGMVDGKSGNLLDLGKGQLEAVRAVFLNPRL